ncbi:DUF4004 family protein [Mycoplasmatota bacterium WC44]
MQISKKELLELTEISYGQLYRWKRKGLIPDSWFIKKSSFTGQETFFPKDEILERIKKILELKDLMPLEEIKEYLSGSHYFRVYKKSEINNLFDNTSALSENVSYYDLVSLELIKVDKKLDKEVSNISNLLNEEALELCFYYFLDKNLWIISKNVITNDKFMEVDIQEVVKSVNKKLSDGGVV